MVLNDFRTILELARLGLSEVAKNVANQPEVIASCAMALAEGKKHALSMEASEAKAVNQPSNSG